MFSLGERERGQAESDCTESTASLAERERERELALVLNGLLANGHKTALYTSNCFNAAGARGTSKGAH